MKIPFIPIQSSHVDEYVAAVLAMVCVAWLIHWYFTDELPDLRRRKVEKLEHELWYTEEEYYAEEQAAWDQLMAEYPDYDTHFWDRDIDGDWSCTYCGAPDPSKNENVPMVCSFVEDHQNPIVTIGSFMGDVLNDIELTKMVDDVYDPTNQVYNHEESGL